MFQNLINNLGSEYEPFKKVFRTGKLVDAFEELNKIEDEKSDLLKAFVLILLKKTKRALEYLNRISIDEIFFIEKDIYYELIGFCKKKKKNFAKKRKINAAKSVRQTPRPLV